MKTKIVMVCDECSNTLEPVKDLIELICLPFEWYMDKDLLKKYDVYQCKDCHRIYRKRKLLSYYLNKVIKIIKGLIYK